MIKILALTVNPLNTKRLRIDLEFKDIQLELSNLKLCFFEFISYGAIQSVDLNILLERHKPDILHFSGHGSEQALYLEDENGRAVELGIAHLEHIFRLNSGISLVFFNSCLSENLAASIAPYVQCIVGSTTKVKDSDAILFSKSFYSFLGKDNSIKKAFDFAKSQVNVKGGSSDFILKSLNVDHVNTIVSFRPQLLAKFFLNEKGEVSKIIGIEYSMAVFVQPLPPDISEANYYFNDKTLSKKDRFEISKEADKKFITDVSFYGDIDLRVTLWKSNGIEGYAFGGYLSNALENYYKLYPLERNEHVIKAIAKIKKQ